MTGQAAMVQLLLDAKADPNKQLKGGQTPLTAACESKVEKVDVARLLLERDVDLDLCTADGVTALMIASKNGHNALARMLLNAGAQTKEAMKGRGTALAMAAWVGNADCVRMLIEEGNDEDLEVTFQNKTPLQLAEKGGHAVCVDLIADALRESPAIPCAAKGGGGGVGGGGEEGPEARGWIRAGDDFAAPVKRRWLEAATDREAAARI